MLLCPRPLAMPQHSGTGDEEEKLRNGAPSLCSRQELTRREVVDVTHLEIPAELMGLLEAAAGEWVRHSPHPAPPSAPSLAAGARAAGCVLQLPVR